MVRTVIEIDEDLCNGCGNCVTGCHEGALQLIDGKARLVGDNLCDGLGACIGECPVGAIEFVEREATAYSEREVLERILPLGENTVVAHLKHLKDHGQKEFVHEGFAILTEKGWDAAAVRAKVLGSSAPLGAQGHGGGGCPGSRVVDFTPRAEPQPAAGVRAPAASQLRQWPVQLHLVPPSAPYLQACDLLVAADCVPFAHANFHQDFLKGRVLLIGCPKLDDTAYYAEKLTQIFSLNDIRSVTVARMEVPCCGGITQAVRTAIAASGRVVPYAEAVISIEGKLLPPR
jgi:NAD-dependent dihydropyrimidine dehydrogenase PreA subunit